MAVPPPTQPLPLAHPEAVPISSKGQRADAGWGDHLLPLLGTRSSAMPRATGAAPADGRRAAGRTRRRDAGRGGEGVADRAGHAQPLGPGVPGARHGGLDRLRPPRRRTALNPEQQQRAADLLHAEHSLRSVALELDVNRETLRQYRLSGSLPEPQAAEPAAVVVAEPEVAEVAAEAEADAPGALERTARDMRDAAATMGRATRDVAGRVAASLGLGAVRAPRFEHLAAVPWGGLLVLLPTLLQNGLLRRADLLPALHRAFYNVADVLLLLAFLLLARQHTAQSLARQAPGEWGALLGLDRVPDVKTFRAKLHELAADGPAVSAWHAALAADWLQADPEVAATVCLRRPRADLQRAGALGAAFRQPPECVPAGGGQLLDERARRPAVPVPACRRRQGLDPSAARRPAAAAARPRLPAPGGGRPDRAGRRPAGADRGLRPRGLEPGAVRRAGTGRRGLPDVAQGRQGAVAAQLVHGARRASGRAGRAAARQRDAGRAPPEVEAPRWRHGRVARDPAAGRARRASRDGHHAPALEHGRGGRSDAGALEPRELLPGHEAGLRLGPAAGVRGRAAGSGQHRAEPGAAALGAADRRIWTGPGCGATRQARQATARGAAAVAAQRETEAAQLLAAAAAARAQRWRYPEHVPAGELAPGDRLECLAQPLRLLYATVRMLAYRAETHLLDWIGPDGGHGRRPQPTAHRQPRQVLQALYATPATLRPDPQRGLLRVELLHLANPALERAVAPLLAKLNETGHALPRHRAATALLAGPRRAVARRTAVVARGRQSPCSARPAHAAMRAGAGSRRGCLPLSARVVRCGRSPCADHPARQRIT